jgi:hypothetical protein
MVVMPYIQLTARTAVQLLKELSNRGGGSGALPAILVSTMASTLTRHSPVHKQTKLFMESVCIGILPG